MATVIGEFIGKIGVDTAGFTKGINDADTRMGKFASKFAEHRKAIGYGMTAIGGAIVGGFGLSMKSAAEFEAGMREVNTMMGLGQEEFESMSKDVLNLAKDLGVDAVGATEALYQAISAGVPKENAIDFLSIATKAAIGGVTDTETAVDGLTTVMNAFKIPMEDTQEIADVMFATVKSGKTTFEELSSKMFNVAPIASAMGVSFEEVSAAIATMTKQGYPTAQATTAIRQAMVSLQKPTKEMQDAIAGLGYESGQAMIDELGFAGAIETLRESTGGSNEMLMKMFGSVEAGGGVLALTGDNASTFASDLAAMQAATEGAGAATEAFNEVERGSARQFEKVQESIKGVVIEIGNELLPKLTPLIEKVGEVIGKVSDWMEKNPELTSTIVKIVGAVGGLMLLLGPLLLILPGLGIAFGALMGPIGLVGLAIVGLVAYGIFLWQNWDRITSDIMTLWENVVHFFTGMALTIRDIFVNIGEAMWAPIKWAIDLVVNYIDSIMTAISNLLGWINQILRPSWVIKAKTPEEKAEDIERISKEQDPRIGLQHGGIVTRPTVAMIGEAGAEAVIPLDRAGGLGEINITLSGIFMGNEAEARKLATLIRKYLRGEERHLYGSPLA